jgi:arylsulfatase
MEGRTLAPALSGKPLKNAVQYFEHEGNRAVRDGKWKIVAEGEDSPWELYDMEADRTEMNNLAGKHPDIVMRMDRLYRTWAVRTKVLPNKKPDDKGA